MTPPARIALIMPVLNERDALPLVLYDLPDLPGLEVIVVDNGSTDGSGEIAERLGARVVREPRRGYGSACLAGIAAAGNADVVAFLDADHSDHAEQLPEILRPLLDDEADLVIGSRLRGEREAGALPIHAQLGNRLAVALIRLFWSIRYTDLGPFRAIRRDALERLDMCDRGYGWTVEMQAKAAAARLRVAEVPARYRNRVGRSKITGTVRGTIAAGSKILTTIARLRARLGPRVAPPDEPREILVSAIVPTLGESRHLGSCLDALARQEGPVEVIVVDGGSDDGTLEIAERAEGVRVVRTAAGRGRQMNVGARLARGSALWFVHADSVVDPGAASAIRRALDDPATGLGCFELALGGSRRGYRWIERGVHLRTRYLGLPYGDQGLFLRRADFRAVAGYPEGPLLEDVELVKRMRSRGRLAPLPITVTSSARRWESGGLLKTSGENVATLVSFLLGGRRRAARLRAPARRPEAP